MSVPTVYKSTDANAPVLSGTKGSLVNLLTQCLVTGYSGKAPAGWTRDFSNVDLTIACFRNSSVAGNGVFLQIDELSATAANFYAQGYEVMTGLTTGVGPFHSTAAGYTGYKSDLANTAARPWLLVATNRFMYFVVWAPSVPTTAVSNLTCILSFGDFDNFNAEGYNSALGMSYFNSYTVFQGGLLPLDALGAVGGGYLKSSRPLSGVSGAPINLWHHGPYGPGGYVNLLVGAMKTGQGLPYSGKLLLAKSGIGDASSYNFRGMLPGLWHPCHPGPSFTNLQTVVSGEKTFLCIKVFTYYSGYIGDLNIFIETSGGWHDYFS